MVAFTYYGHREKLRHIGREDDLEPLNRDALRIAREVAAEGDALLAGEHLQHVGLRPGRCRASGEVVREMYREQVAWGRRGGRRPRHRRDERLPRRGADRRRGRSGRPACPSVVTFAMTSGHDDRRRSTSSRPAGGSRRRAPTSSGSTARAGPRRCCRCSSASARPCRARSRPSPCRTGRRPSSRPSSRCARRTARRAFPLALDPFVCTRFEMADFAVAARDLGVALHRHLLRRRASPRACDGRGARPHGAREPLLAGPLAPPGARRRAGHGGCALRRLGGLGAFDEGARRARPRQQTPSLARAGGELGLDIKQDAPSW